MFEQSQSRMLINAMITLVVGEDSKKTKANSDVNAFKRRESVTGESITSATPESEPGNFTQFQSKGLPLLFIQRIDCLNEKLSLSTLALFNSVLSVQNADVIDRLVLFSLENAQHILPSERIRYLIQASGALRSIDKQNLLSPLPDLSEVHRELDFDDYLVDAQAEGQLWMDVWEKHLNSKLWMPSSTVSSNSGCSADLASKQSNDVISTSSNTDQILSSLTSSQVGISSEGSDDFEESAFMYYLLNKLEQFYSNSFEANMLLTSVIAKVAYCPDNLLHSYLFDPALPTVSSCRKLMVVLGNLWNQGKQLAEKTDNFEKQLAETIKNLNSNSISVISIENQRFFQALIVIKEFVKELLAISQAKSNVYGLYKLASGKMQEVVQLQAKLDLHINTEKFPERKTIAVPLSPTPSISSIGIDDDSAAAVDLP
jgi:hypothetical protein